MAKFVHRPLKVSCDQNNDPSSVLWNDSVFEVKVLEHWKDTGCWWRGEREKDFFRLGIEPSGCLGEQLWEIYFDTGNESWWMYKIYD